MAAAPPCASPRPDRCRRSLRPSPPRPPPLLAPNGRRSLCPVATVPPHMTPRPGCRRSMCPNPARPLAIPARDLDQGGCRRSRLASKMMGVGDPIGTRYPRGVAGVGGFETRHGWWVRVAGNFNPGGVGCVLVPPPGFPPATIPSGARRLHTRRRGPHRLVAVHDG
jgi:hypothetical protein